MMDFVDDYSAKIVGQVQLKKLGDFLNNYSAQLEDIQDALHDSSMELNCLEHNPIQLEMTIDENLSLPELLTSDSLMLNKVLLVLVSLSDEIHELCSEANDRFIPMLLLYAEGNCEEMNQMTPLLQMGAIMERVQELSIFLLQCHRVTKAVIHQLSTLYSRDQGSVINTRGMHFLTLMQHLGKLLVCLLTLDEVIKVNSAIKEQWDQYRRILKSVEHNPDLYNLPSDEVKELQIKLCQFDIQMFSGNILKDCIGQNFDFELQPISKNTALSDELIKCIEQLLHLVDLRVGDLNETDERSKFAACVQLLVLHSNIFQIVDKRLFRSVWDFQKYVTFINLEGNIIWQPNAFLLELMPKVVATVDKKAALHVQNSATSWLENQENLLFRERAGIDHGVSMWMIKLHALSMDCPQNLKELNSRSFLIFQGLLFASKIQLMVKSVLNVHAKFNIPLSKTVVLEIGHYIELLKAIKFLFLSKGISVSQSVRFVVQHLAHIALKLLNSAQKRVGSEKRSRDKYRDILPAIVLAQDCLSGSPTKLRKLVLQYTLHVIQPSNVLKEGEFAELQGCLKKLDILSEFCKKLTQATDCSFLFWHRVLLPSYLDDLFQKASMAQRLHLMFAAANDCVPILKKSLHVPPNVLLSSYHQELKSYIKVHLLDPLCRYVETDLRLHTHSHLQLEDRNPFRVALPNISALLHLQPIKLVHSRIYLKSCVERYLDQTFYNLTTVALHDWKTYGQMKSIALQKYKLKLMEPHLPSQTLEQGIDVLEIMRNIHIFVSRYQYNLNNQIFVEISSNNKHLNTICIEHVSNSIRTHGTGIMNTTVNFVYQFLRKQFFKFSQFLHDEHIKSRLLKDWKFFKDNHLSTDQKYPFERADKFNRGIRKLGLTQEGLSYLDQFRMLVTQMGNAMGTIRLVRSGGLHWCEKAIQFVPDLEEQLSFEEMTSQVGLSESAVQAARMLDQVVGNLTKSFAEGTEYFKILVDVFAPEFQLQKNMHLKNFFIILPPLILNFVEYSIGCKEKLDRKNKVGASFTDDGFMIGVAYILKTLDQYDQFDSLHWFQSVSEKYASEKVKTGSQSQSGKYDEKLEQTMMLTMKRLQTYQQEFDLLYYSLTSAKIFFRADLKSTALPKASVAIKEENIEEPDLAYEAEEKR